jgi:hypothetical protein
MMRILNIPWRIKQACLNVAFYLRYGFKRSDTWSLDITLAEWLIPRLRYFRESHNGYPSELTPELWDEKIGLMLRAFELIAADDYSVSSFDPITAEINAGLATFSEYFQALWD